MPMKLLTKTLISLAIASIISGCDTQKTDVEYLESAKNYASQGDEKAFIIDLKSALQANPSNQEARLLLGNYYLNRQQGALAEKEFKRAIDAGAAAQLLAAELAQAQLYQYQFEEILDIDTESLDKDEQTLVYFYQGLATISLHQPSEAKANFAAAANGSGTYSKLASAYGAALERNFDQATEQLQRLLAQEPNNAEALILSSRLLSAQQKHIEAGDTLARVLELQPNRRHLNLIAAQAYLDGKAFEQAEQHVDTVLKFTPNHLLSNLLKAKLRLQAKDWEAASAAAGIVLNGNSNTPEARLVAGIAAFNLQKWEQAHTHLRTLKDTLKPGDSALQMLHYTASKLGLETTADEVINSIGSIDKDNKALVSLFGNSFLRAGSSDEALKLFEAYADADPDNTNIQTGIGALKLASGDTTGLDEIQAVLKKDPAAYRARVALIRYHLQQQQTAQALKVAKDYLPLKPNDLNGYLLVADILRRTGDPSRAKEVLNKALSIETPTGKTSEVLGMLTSIALQENNLSNAERYLNEILEIEPDNRSALIGMYRLQKRLGDTSRFESRLTQLLESQSTPALQLIAAQIAADQAEYTRSLALLEQIPDDAPQHEDALAVQGQIHLAQQQFSQAASVYEQWQNEYPSSEQALFGEVYSLALSGQTDAALFKARQSLEKKPNQELAIAEILILLENDRQEQARQQTTRFLQTYQATPGFYWALGKHYASTKDYSESAKQFAQMHQLAQSSQSLMLYAESLTQAKQVQQADKLIADWLAEHPNDKDVLLYATNRDIVNNDIDHSKSIQRYRAILKQDPNNYIAMNNLAWLLGEQGQVQQALRYARAAQAEKPGSANVLDTLGHLLLKAGDHAQAVDTLAKAYQLAPQNPSLGYRYALALSESKQPGKAKEVLEPLLDKQFPELAQAKTLMKNL